jgi:hypothetical protein
VQQIVGHGRWEGGKPNLEIKIEIRNSPKKKEKLGILNCDLT